MQIMSNLSLTFPARRLTLKHVRTLLTFELICIKYVPDCFTRKLIVDVHLNYYNFYK